MHSKKVAQCALPSCYHYIPVAMAIGKLSLCNFCPKTLKLVRRLTHLAKPHCGCRSRTQAAAEKVMQETSSVLDDILGAKE